MDEIDLRKLAEDAAREAYEPRAMHQAAMRERLGVQLAGASDAKML